MNYKILYTSEAKSQIDRLDGKTKRQLKTALERLSLHSELGKRLTHELSEFFSYRVGDYRIIYKLYIQEVLILVLTVGHRKDVYKKMRH